MNGSVASTVRVALNCLLLFAVVKDVKVRQSATASRRATLFFGKREWNLVLHFFAGWILYSVEFQISSTRTTRTLYCTVSCKWLAKFFHENFIVIKSWHYSWLMRLLNSGAVISRMVNWECTLWKRRGFVFDVEFFGFGRVKREVWWLNDGSIEGKVPKSAMKKKSNEPME